METIKISETAKTPSVYFDAEKGIIEIKGRSIPEDTIGFYKPLFDWLREYSSKKQEKSVVNMQLEYFNTSSSKCIIEIFKKLEDVAKSGTNVTVNWYYAKDDDEILASGEEFKTLVRLPFRFIEVK